MRIEPLRVQLLEIKQFEVFNVMSFKGGYMNKIIISAVVMLLITVSMQGALDSENNKKAKDQLQLQFTSTLNALKKTNAFAKPRSLVGSGPDIMQLAEAKMNDFLTNYNKLSPQEQKDWIARTKEEARDEKSTFNQKLDKLTSEQKQQFKANLEMLKDLLKSEDISERFGPEATKALQELADKTFALID
jgi:alpha-amylase/alpha-mannosidase (GH57 family)